MLHNSTGNLVVMRDSAERARPTGHITLICGPMFAGKTSEMIRILERYERAGRRCVIVKFARDDRYAADAVVTHRGVRTPISTVSVELLADANDAIAGADVIGVDEGQFYADVADWCAAHAAAGKIIIMSYLDATFERRPFGPIGELVAMSETVVKLSAVCGCGSEAHFSKRTAGGTAIEQIGGEEAYRAACRVCFDRAA